jgi:branched-chain amino acid transport system permease protein
MKSSFIECGMIAAFAIVGVLFAAIGSPYVAQTLFAMAMAVLLAVGWNFIGGFTGYVSFGQVSFFGIGAYAAAITLLNTSLHWYEAAALAALVSTAVAVPLGLIMLRLRGIFFALGMFGLARIMQIAATSLSITGGPMGTSVNIAASPNLCAGVMVAAAALAVAGSAWAMRTKFGLRLLAVRDDAVAAQAAGINIALMRVAAFCVSAGIAGLGGALYVWNIGYLDPGSAFNGSIELQTILIVMVGGIGTVIGPLLGGILISIISTTLWANFPTEQQIILGGLTIFMAVIMPRGIIGTLQRRQIVRRSPIAAPRPSELSAWRAARPVAPDRPSPIATEATPVLDCRKLGIRFGGLVAVQDVDLIAHSHELLAIIGPNGAGKSTLMNLVSAFARPNTGQVHFAGQQLGRLRPEQLARKGVARTFQTSRLFASLTVWETVLLATSALHTGMVAAREAAGQLLASVGLLDAWHEYPETLSPGRQRLLEIARALALRPKVLLLDEAMAGMSAQEIARVHQALNNAMNGGCAIIAIEHVLPAIAPLAARVQVLDFGRTIAVGIPHDVLNDPAVISAYIGSDESAAYA